MQTIVSTKYQVVIPKAVRKRIGLKPGQKMNVVLSGEQIVLSTPVGGQKLNWPHDHLERLKNIWKNADVDKYLEEERNSWQ
jgi:AbrB family looped-hinge helix DNA binding protein